MRNDMGRIAVDAYRYGGCGSAKFSQKHQKHRGIIDERPTKESMSRTKLGTKELGENLSPLKRWLRKQAGRRWNDVYSDIASALRGGYTNLEHIKTHIFHWVHLRGVKIVDGWPHIRSSWGSGLYELQRWELYVDNSGILRTVPEGLSPRERMFREKKDRPSNTRVVGDTLYLKHNGLWYKGNIEKLPLVKKRVPDTREFAVRGLLTYRFVEEPANRRDAYVMKLELGKVKRDSLPSPWIMKYNTAPYDWHTHYVPRLFSMSKKEIRDFRKKFGELTEG